MKEHYWIVNITFPITQQELNQMRARGMIHVETDLLEERPSKTMIYCVTCRLNADDTGTNCPGEPVGFADDGTPVHIDRN